MIRNHQQRGITFIELLISVVIIGILAAFAIPNYSKYVMRSHRAEGIATLNSIALEQEKYRSNNTTYGNINSVWPSTTTDNGYYTLAVSSPTSTGYTATATAVGNQASDSEAGTSCATLTMVLNGLTTTRTPTGCWSR